MSTMAKIGDLVILEMEDLKTGVVLEISYWYNERDKTHERDLYILWSDGNRFWVLEDGVKVFRKKENE
jgi:hypothetical protein